MLKASFAERFVLIISTMRGRQANNWHDFRARANAFRYLATAKASTRPGRQLSHFVHTCSQYGALHSWL